MEFLTSWLLSKQYMRFMSLTIEPMNLNKKLRHLSTRTQMKSLKNMKKAIKQHLRSTSLRALKKEENLTIHFKGVSLRNPMRLIRRMTISITDLTLHIPKRRYIWRQITRNRALLLHQIYRQSR
jgi:hypothetical protein